MLGLNPAGEGSAFGIVASKWRGGMPDYFMIDYLRTLALL